MFDVNEELLLMIGGKKAAALSSLLTGLVAYYKMEESSGTRADATGRGNDLTDTNAVGQTTGKVGYGGLFVPASNQRLERASNTDLTLGGGGFTIDGWCWFSSSAAYSYILAKASTTVPEYMLYLQPTGPKLVWVFYSPAAVVTTLTNTTIITLNAWHYFRCGYDAVAKKSFFQVDDTAVQTVNQTAGVKASTGDFYIGDNKNDPGYRMNGKIDEVGLWKRLFTSDEITTRYNGGGGKTYPFDGNSNGAATVWFIPVGDSKAVPATMWPPYLVAYDVVNKSRFYLASSSFAVGGQSILGGRGTPSLLASIDADIAGVTHTPNAIFWNIGVNDAHPLNGYPPVEADWKAGVLYCWDAIRTKWPNVPIYMMYVWRAAQSGYPDLPANCSLIDGWYSDILPSRSFVSVIADERIWYENGDNGATYSGDGTHYNDVGKQKVADLWRAGCGR